MTCWHAIDPALPTWYVCCRSLDVAKFCGEREEKSHGIHPVVRTAMGHALSLASWEMGEADASAQRKQRDRDRLARAVLACRQDALSAAPGLTYRMKDHEREIVGAAVEHVLGEGAGVFWALISAATRKESEDRP